MAHSGQNARQSRRSLRWAGRLAGLVVGAGAACLPSSGRADAILTWNDELLSAIRQTSGLMVDGPPEVAREMAMVDTAMYDAVNAASGLPYSRYAYTGPAVANASVDAAALSAGYQVMNSIFSNPIWAHNPGGSAAIQSSVLASIGSTYNTALAALGTGSAVTAGLSLGQTAAGDMIANRATDGSGPAIITGLTPYTPPGSGTVPGVYVPPSASGGRPAMFPTWNTVKPFGIPLSTDPSQRSPTAHRAADQPARPARVHSVCPVCQVCSADRMHRFGDAADRVDRDGLRCRRFRAGDRRAKDRRAVLERSRHDNATSRTLVADY